MPPVNTFARVLLAGLMAVLMLAISRAETAA